MRAGPLIVGMIVDVRAVIMRLVIVCGMIVAGVIMRSDCWRVRAAAGFNCLKFAFELFSALAQFAQLTFQCFDIESVCAEGDGGQAQ